MGEFVSRSCNAAATIYRKTLQRSAAGERARAAPTVKRIKYQGDNGWSSQAASSRVCGSAARAAARMVARLSASARAAAGIICLALPGENCGIDRARPAPRPGQRPGGYRPGQRPGGYRPGQRPGGYRPGQRPGGQRPGGYRPGQRISGEEGYRPGQAARLHSGEISSGKSRARPIGDGVPRFGQRAPVVPLAVCFWDPSRSFAMTRTQWFGARVGEGAIIGEKSSPYQRRFDIGRRVLDRRAAGEPWSAIAASLGVHRTTAWRYALDAQIEARRKAPRSRRLRGDQQLARAKLAHGMRGMSILLNDRG